MQTNEIIRVAIIGPESTGKSTLSAALANHFNTVWVKEYAREYIENLQNPYTFDDITAIAKGQLAAENKLVEQANRYLFCDTTLLVTKIWQEHLYGHCDNFIHNNLIINNYDLHLLTNTDIPWEFDKQREHPHLREYFMEVYEKALQQMGVNYATISGAESTYRLQMAITSIEKLKSPFSI